MSRNLFENQEGISNLVATLILIAVAVVGGAFIYSAFRNQAQTATNNASMRLQNITAVNTSGTDNTYISATIKNTGTELLTGVTVSVDGKDCISISSLDPGMTGSDSASDIGKLSSGQEYVVQITADTPAGGSVTNTTTVRVKS